MIFILKLALGLADKLFSWKALCQVKQGKTGDADDWRAHDPCIPIFTLGRGHSMKSSNGAHGGAGSTPGDDAWVSGSVLGSEVSGGGEAGINAGGRVEWAPPGYTYPERPSMTHFYFFLFLTFA